MSAKYAITLSVAQYYFVKDLIVTHESLGDCELHGFKLTFDDYEGLRAFQSGLLSQKIPTTRDYITLQSISKKLDAAAVAKAKA